MSLLSACLIATSLLLAAVLSFSVYFNIKHGMILLDTQDAIEKSLDVLDNSYSKLSEILEKPLFFDSVEVRQVISEIQDARDAILYIANEMSDIDQSPELRESKNVEA